MALTKTDVDELEYPYGNSNASYVVQDKGTGSVQGFGVRVFPNGKKRSILRYSFAGRRRIMQLGEYGKAFTVQKARKKAEAARVKIA